MFDYTKKGKWWDIGVKVIQGCTRVSKGCKHCWSLAMEHRFNQGTDISFHFNRLYEKMKKKDPTAFAIWNDLFHESVPFEYLEQVFSKMVMYEHHNYLILTKRPQRVIDFLLWYWKDDKLTLENMHPVPSNIWIGVTAENQKMADERIPLLLKIPAIRFVSCEPLLDHIDGYFYDKNGKPIENWISKVNWIIAGAETGAVKRPMKNEWIRSLWKQCHAEGKPFFDKQNALGLDIKEMPEHEQIGNPITV